MSAFNRVMHIPASRRAYSYFSSRSGGGRYFNSAKPPKAPAVVAGKAVVSTNPTSSSSSSKAESSVDNKQAASQPNNGVSASSTDPSASSSSVQNGSSQANGVGSSASNSSSTPSNQDFSFNSSLDSRKHLIPPPISAKDFKMHQFFTLHRPLLLISHPSSLFRAVPFDHPLFNPLPPSEADIHSGVMQAISGLGEPTPGSSGLVDADAEAARQLTKALALTKAGATVSWEETLKTLGLDLSKDAERVNLQEQFEKDWEDVIMDSTKRKRRKKMKKHKLKKRRRATRSERLRLK